MGSGNSVLGQGKVGASQGPGSNSSSAVIPSSDIQGFGWVSIESLVQFESRLSDNLQIINDLNGISGVSYDKEKNELRVHYNSSVTNIEQVRARITESIKKPGMPGSNK